MLTTRRLRNILLLFVVTFGLSFSNITAQEKSERTVATVKFKNAQPASVIEHRDLLLQLAMEPNVTLNPPTRVSLIRALQFVINQRLILLSALETEKVGLAQPTDAEINQYILSISNHFPTLAELENRIRVAGFSSLKDENFKRKMSERLIIEKYIDFRFRSRVVIDSKEEENYYQKVFVPEFRRRNPEILIPNLEKQRPQIKLTLTELKIAGDIEDFLIDVKSNAEIVIFDQTKPINSVVPLPNRKSEPRLPTECELMPDHFRGGIEYLERNLALCRAADNKLAIPVIIRAIGNTYQSQGKTTEALEKFQEGLALSESLGDKEGVIWAMLGIGEILTNQDSKEQPLDYLRKALALSEELGDKRSIAASLQYLGRFYQLKEKNYAQALTLFEKELKLREEIGEKNGLANVLSRIGTSYRIEGNFSKALEYHLRSLMLFEEIGYNKWGTIGALNAISFIYSEQGYYTQALEFYDRSLRIKEELKNPQVRFENDFFMIAVTYRLQGNYPKALEYYQKVLQLHDLDEILGLPPKEPAMRKDNSAVAARQTENPFAVNISKIYTAGIPIVSTLNHIGSMYLYNNDYDSATKYLEEALRIIRTIEENNEVLIAARKTGDLNSRSAITRFCEQNADKSPNTGFCVTALNNIHYFYMITQRGLATLNLRYGKYELALEHYQKMLPYCEKSGQMADINCVAALSNIGYIYGLQGKSAKGLEFADRASTTSKLLSSFSSFEGYWLTGDAYRLLGQLDKARKEFEKALSQYESTSAKITDEAHRLTFIERTDKNAFELYIEVLMQLHKQRPAEGFDALALQASERFRARLLVELLNESHVDIRQGVDPKLLARERELHQQLNERAAQQTRLLTGNYNAEQAAALQKGIDALTVDFQQTKAQIRINSPRYAALTQPQPLTASEIKRDLLDADTVLLEYALGVERSYLWVVTSTSLKSYELPKLLEIENDVRRVVSLLNDGKRWALDEKINAEYLEAAISLSRKLLPPGLMAQLKGKRLAIVADGALQYLPFGALPLPQESKPEKNLQKKVAVPLAVEYEIVSLPSASALAVQRREVLNRKPATKSIAIYADPVFSETDERLTAVIANQSKIKQAARTDLNRLFLERAFNLNGEKRESLSIPRLPFTRREAEGIFVEASSTSALKALDFEASRNNLLKSDVSGYRIVHFATHGLLNSQYPELSGIVLSLVDEQGQPVDGFLRLNEIYNLNLSADLVVLSACQTALGKEVRGEGLIGLTRGFMYAGSPSVVASLWKVDEVATAELMKIFYRKMLKEKMRPAAALRAAKVEMWKQKRWNAPFYWAAFEIQGEWR
jgi:CHAT domain-containing protein